MSVNIKLYNFNPFYWKYESDLVKRTGIFNDTTELFYINPQVISDLSATKTDKLTPSQIVSNFKTTSSTDVSFSSDFLKSNWTSKGWATDSIKFDLKDWLVLQFSDVSLNPTQDDLNIYLVEGNFSGSDYIGAFAMYASQGEEIFSNLPGSEILAFNSLASGLYSGLNLPPTSTAVQTDGKIVVGGSFTTLNGKTVIKKLIRLNADLSLDTAFNDNVPSTFTTQTPIALCLENSGTILVSYGNNPYYLARINSDGSLSSVLTSGFNGPVSTLAVQSDGKILASGGFTQFNGIPRNHFLRLESDGTEEVATELGTKASFSGDLLAVAPGASASYDDVIVSEYVYSPTYASFSNYPGYPSYDVYCGTGMQPMYGSFGNAIVVGDGVSTFQDLINTLTALTGIPYYISSGSSEIIPSGYTINIAGGTGDFSHFYGEVNVEGGGTAMVAVFAESQGASYDVTITGDGYSSISSLLGYGYVFTAGGDTILQNGDSITLYGGVPRLTCACKIQGSFANISITGDGLKTCQELIDTEMGESGFFNITAGGSSILSYGETVNITGGVGSVSKYEGTINSGTDTLKVYSTKALSDTNGISITGNGYETCQQLFNYYVPNPWETEFLCLVGGNVVLGYEQVFLAGGATGTQSVSVAAECNTRGEIGNNIFNLNANALLSDLLGSNYTVTLGSEYTLIKGQRIIFSGGTNDNTFNSRLGKGFNDGAYSVLPQIDGSIIIGATQGFGGNHKKGLVKLDSLGNLETPITPGTKASFSGSVSSQQGGTFTLTAECLYAGEVFNGSFFGDGTSTCNELLGYHNITAGGNEVPANGATITFSGGTNDSGLSGNNITNINMVSKQDDGKYLVAGAFSQVNGQSRGRLCRFNSDGSEDTSFNTNLGTGANGVAIKTTIYGSKIVVIGKFTSFNGSTRNGIVQLNLDGTEDASFYSNVGTGCTIAFSAAGLYYLNSKILFFADFTSFNSSARRYIQQLEPNGVESKVPEEISGENPGLGTTGAARVVVQPDSKVIVAGNFTLYNGKTRNRILRFNADGTEDISFSANTGLGFNADVYALALQTDGKILVGGNFTSYNGSSINRMIRLNGDGTVDTAFKTNLGTAFAGIINNFAIQGDGKIIVGGDFTSFKGSSRSRIVRLNSDGTEDTAFYTNCGAFSSSVYAVTLQSDSKILVGGSFTTVKSVARKYLVRLNSDGTMDTSFYTNLGTSFNNYVFRLSLQTDGKIVVSGYFSTFNGVSRGKLIRLNSDGTEDTSFYSNLGIAFTNAGTNIRTTLQSDSKILVYGSFSTFNNLTRYGLIRLNTDGTEDTPFYTNLGGAPGTTEVALLPNGDLAVCGGSLSLTKPRYGIMELYR